MISPIKYAGSKAKSVNAIIAHLPPSFETYYEPFLGGGSIALAVLAGNRHRWKFNDAWLSDTCNPLIVMWRALRDAYPETKRALQLRYRGLTQRNAAARYAAVRVSFNLKLLSVIRSAPKFAADFIYLNKNGFNGLWRVNKKGEFNVPFGKRVGTIDFDNLAEVAVALKTVRVHVSTDDFSNTRPGKNDVVYLDPPYHGTFAGYSEEGFTLQDHASLANYALLAAHRGAKVIASQGASEKVAALWKTHDMQKVFVEERVTVHNSVGATAERRGKVSDRLFVSKLR